MTRNTHDLVNDHFGVLTAAQIAGGTSSTGYVPVSNGDGTSTWAAGGNGMTEFLTGNDVYFLSSVGSWVSSSGAVTLDSIAAKAYAYLLKSLKWVSPATTTDYVEVPVTGIFTSGVAYHAVVALMFEESSGSTDFDVILGVPGTDSRTASIHAGTSPTTAIGDSRWLLAFAYWVPSANRSSGVKLRVKRTNASAGTLNVHVGYARVVQPVGAGLLAFADVQVQGSSAQGGELLVPVGDNARTTIQVGGGVSTQSGKSAARIAGDAISVGLLGGGLMNAELFLNRDSTMYLSAGGDVAAADRANNGYELDVGIDYLDVCVNQKDASTIQLWSNYSHSDIELADTGTGHWKMRSTDNGYAIPSRGMLPQFSSAPGSPAEGWSYYDTTLHKSRTWDGTAWQNHW